MPTLVYELSVPYLMLPDGCGSSTFTGVDDRRPVDGNRVAIELVDNTFRTCENVIAGLLVVNAKIDGARGGQTTITAIGNQPLPVAALNEVKSDDRAIYNALQTEEVYLNPGIAGVGRFEKSVGRLTCTKQTLVIARPTSSYKCSLSN